MAKTRIKTTPTRLQKDALVASSAATTATKLPQTPTPSMLAMSQDTKKRLRAIAVSTSAHPKDPLDATSTIIVAAPKRTNSISSVTSSISHASDAHSAHSDSESPPPLSNESPASTTSNIKTLNSLLCKSTSETPLGGTLKNRKVYMITEKCEQPLNTDGVSSTASAASVGGGQKRKMYLIMEETSSATVNGDKESGCAANGAGVDSPQQQLPRKYWQTENESALSSKKLTLYADKCDGELTQKFEKILPEILNRIQAKDATSRLCKDNNSALAKEVNGNGNGHADARTAALENNKRLTITLPPKKNRTKIIAMPQYNNNTNYNHNNNNHSINKTNHNNTLSNGHIQRAGQATPVIVSAVSQGHHSKRKCNGLSTFAQTPLQAHTAKNGQANAINTQPHSQPELKSCHSVVPQKNINLSADFLFLMKMLPKLESIPEPYKNHIKDCIEKIISQNASVNEQP